MSPDQGCDNECLCNRSNQSRFSLSHTLRARGAPLSAATASNPFRTSSGMSAAGKPVVANAGEPLPQRMRRLREASGLSRAEVADRTGLSRPTIWAWESGKSTPRQSNLEILALALGISTQELTGKDQGEAVWNEIDALGLSAGPAVGLPAGAGNAHRLSVLVYAAQLVIASIAGVDARNVRISIRR